MAVGVFFYRRWDYYEKYRREKKIFNHVHILHNFIEDVKNYAILIDE